MKIYNNEIANIKDIIPKKDEYTFSVLRRILKFQNTLVVSDEKTFIICYSCSPFPVWIWTSDDINEGEKNNLYKLIGEKLPAGSGYYYNLKYDFAKFMMNKDPGIVVDTNMYAYNCGKLISQRNTRISPKGEGRLATQDDIMSVYSMIKSFHEELDIDKKDDEMYMEETKELINEKSLYAWYNEAGKVTSICTYLIDENKATVGHVYTPKEKRRMGYAIALVEIVTKHIFDINKEPILYTDANYSASNDCYIKLGYELQGRLCMIKKVQE